MTTQLTRWKLIEWLETGEDRPPMSEKEIQTAIKFLRDNNYPKPADCPEAQCHEHRPACELGVCKIAVVLCGD